jgi:hypothetical protein
MRHTFTIGQKTPSCQWMWSFSESGTPVRAP